MKGIRMRTCIGHKQGHDLLMPLFGNGIIKSPQNCKEGLPGCKVRSQICPCLYIIQKGHANYQFNRWSFSKPQFNILEVL